MGNLILTYAPYGSPIAAIHADIRAARWGWDRRAEARAFWLIGSTSPIPTPTAVLPGQLNLFA